MNPTFHEFVRANAESRWDDELADIEPAFERYRADPAKLENSPFSLLYSADLAWGPSGSHRWRRDWCR